jgi:hypothetical protein
LTNMEPTMREAITNCLWIGNAMDARDIPAVLDLRIVAIVDLAMEEPPIHCPRDIVYCRIPLVDGSGNRPEIIRAAVDLTASLIDSRVPTLGVPHDISTSLWAEIKAVCDQWIDE